MSASFEKTSVWLEWTMYARTKPWGTETEAEGTSGRCSLRLGSREQTHLV
jgi:hypothetical protein